MMKLCIADPPYPPFVGAGGSKTRASRWYGTRQRGKKDRPADVHIAAAEWDEPGRHRRLLEELLGAYDGWAIATSPDGIAVYGPLPPAARIMAWVKPNAMPGSHRLRSMWEAVILYPPSGRRYNRGGVGIMPDVLVEPYPRGFKGKKPAAWTRWVLDAMSYDPDSDTVVDLFTGSGAVKEAIANYQLTLGRSS
jgi:hypothetical protein